LEGAFIFTFLSSYYPYDENPKYDLDMAAFGIVRAIKNPKSSTSGGFPWTPKTAFFKVADYFRWH